MQKTLLLFFFAFLPLALEVVFLSSKPTETREPSAAEPAKVLEVTKTTAEISKEDAKINEVKATIVRPSKSN